MSTSVLNSGSNVLFGDCCVSDWVCEGGEEAEVCGREDCSDDGGGGGGGGGGWGWVGGEVGV